MPDGAPIAPGAGLGVATDEVPVNLTGTVSKNGTTTVTGASTVFLTELSVGQVIRIPGGGGTEDRIVQAIASDTSLTVTVAFTNTAATQTGQRVQHAQLFKLAYSADGGATLAQVDVNGQLVNTELPAAAALSDTTGNPTTPLVGSATMLWDGTNWVRPRAPEAAGGNLTPAQSIPSTPHRVDLLGTNATPEKRADATGDANAGFFIGATQLMMWNGTTLDRVRGDITNGVDVDVTRLPALVAGSAAIGKLAANSGVDIGDVDVTSLPVPPRPATPTLANVAGSASSVTLQASNTARQGWMVTNDSTSALYLKFGSAASATSFTVKLAGGAYYELPQPNYTGIITGIWDTATGSARVTEITA